MVIKHFDQVPEKKADDKEAKDVFMRVLVGPDDGAKNFIMRRFRVLPGGWTPLHTHAWEHEVFILAGQGQMVTDQGPKPVKPGDVLFVPGHELHQFKNTGSADLEFLCLIPANT